MMANKLNFVAMCVMFGNNNNKKNSSELYHHQAISAHNSHKL